MNTNILSVVVVGFGRMGQSHAAAYQEMEIFDLVAICGREHQRSLATSNFPKAEFHLDAVTAIEATKADVVCIATHVDSHEVLARTAMESGAHVFLEKPVAQTLQESEALFGFANELGKKIVAGYVRKHDPLWMTFVEKSKELGSPWVIRFCLDQPSTGDEWRVHQSILKGSSLTFDCAVHYVDMMAKICAAKPVNVMARSVRLHGDASMNGNYGYINVEFSDGSVGSFDSAWGPMVGRANSSITTATGPGGSVSMVSVPETASTETGAETSKYVLLHETTLKNDLEPGPSEAMSVVDIEQEAGDNALVIQQQYLFDSIVNDACMNEHYADVITSMKIVIAADESASKGIVVNIQD